MRDSERYIARAEAVLRMAGRASSPAERKIYESIADGWRKLAVEARRNEARDGSARGGPDDLPTRRVGGG